jgi:hypothetical protein
MKLKWISCLGLCLGAVWLAGCVSTVDGRHRAGIPWVNDRVEGRYERQPKDLWEAAKDVLKYNGVLYGEDILKNTLEANVDQRTVWVKVEPVDPKVTGLIVQCRTKGGAPDVALAGYIKEQIAVRLATGNLTPTTPTKRVF